MVREQLEKMGLKPKRKEKTKREERKEEIEKFLEKIKSDENKRKNMASFVPASKDKRLGKATEEFVKHAK